MTKRTRRNHSPTFKVNVAVAALKGEKTLGELARLHDVHPSQIAAWKARLLEGAAGLFDGSLPTVKEAAPAVDVKSLHAKIGELTVENGFFGRCARQGQSVEREVMTGRSHELPLMRQAALPGKRLSHLSGSLGPGPVLAETDLFRASLTAA